MKMDITAPSGGVIKQLFRTKAPDKDGLILQIEKDPLKAHSRFTHCALDKMGHILGAVNQKGDLLIIDIVHNKYWSIPSIYSCTVLEFSPLNDSELILGATNGSVIIVNIETGEVSALLKGHKLPVSAISFSKDYHCLTSTSTEAKIWNLRNNLELQTLQMKGDMLLKHITFLPVSNDILACFHDDSMQVWSCQSFSSYRQILPSSWNKTTVKSLAFTRNGRAMVVGGHSASLAIFSLDVWQYVKTLSLPEYIQSIRSLSFVPEPFDGGSNKTLAILTGNGIVYFFNMNQKRIVSKIMAIQEIVRISVSGDGKYLSCILSTGQVHLYLVHEYLKGEEAKREVKKTKSVKSTASNKIKSKKSSTLMALQKEMQDMLDTEKLKKILKVFGSYPDEHRVKIWCKLLELPNNVEEYAVISRSQSQTPFDDIEKKYPLENKVAVKNLKRALLNICTWSPFFKKVEYLPVFVFPFVHVFQNEPVLCFEAIVTIIMNWCQHWFEYHPMPPINILAIIENVLMEHDVALLRHLNDLNITSETYAWALLEMAFTENLSRSDWLVLFDHVFSNEPAFLLFSVVAYNITNRNALLSIKNSEEVEFFYHNQNPIDVKKLIGKTYGLMASTTERNQARQYLNGTRSIPKGHYPMFSDFPKAIFEQKTKESVEYNLEEEALKNEIEMLKKLQEKAEKDAEMVNKNLVQEERVKELEEMCKEKFRSEIERIKNERKRIAELRKKLAEEELALLELNTKRMKASSVLEKQTKLEKIIGRIDDEKQSSQMDVLHAETELVRHYSNLLKNRLQIEGLVTRKHSNDEMVNRIIEHKQVLVDEINDIHRLVDSKRYLKQLSVATGLAAMDNLIERVESELRSPNGKPPQTIVETLQAESIELEYRVKDLLALIEEHKQANRSLERAKSLNTLEELVTVTDYEALESRGDFAGRMKKR